MPNLKIRLSRKYFSFLKIKFMRDKKSTVLYQWFQEVWNESKEESIDKLMADDANAHGLIAEGQPKGAAGFKIFYKNFREQFQDIQIDIEEVVSQDDMECARTKVTAIDTGSGKKVKFSGLCMTKIKGGKIAEAWNHYDFLDMYQQLGHVLTPQGA
jgi:predicted ester cyclase